MHMELLNLLFVFLAIVTGTIGTAYAIPVIISVAKQKGLIDVPDTERKIHRGKIPTLGGIAMFAGFLISYSIWVGTTIPAYYPFLVAALMILFFIGIKDDILVISPRKKFLAQVGASALVVIGGNVRITHFDGFLGLHDGVPEVLAILATIFAFLIIINAFNLIDGIDGLAGGVTLLGAIFFGIWFFANGYQAEAILAAALAGTSIGFLIYNHHPAKIFMGDTGSLTTGMIMSVLAFRLIALAPESSAIPLQTPTVFAFSLMIIPMFDTFRVIMIRVLNGRAPFSADSRHLHHCLLRFGYNHKEICILLGTAAIIIMVTSYFINHLDVHLYGLIIMVMATAVMPLGWLIKRIVRKEYINKRSKLFDRKAFMEDMIKPCLTNNGNGLDSKPREQGYVPFNIKKFPKA